MDFKSIIFVFLLLLIICFFIFLLVLKLKHKNFFFTNDNEAKSNDELLKKNNEIEQNYKISEKEKNLLQRENEINIKSIQISEKEKSLEQLKVKLNNDVNEIESLKQELKNKEEYFNDELQRISSLTLKEAKKEVMLLAEKETKLEAISYKKDMLEKVKNDVEKTSKKIIALAVSRFARDEATSLMTTNIFLPNDEIKGKLIGKEGRNIKVLEQVLKIDLIIDDTPGVVVISSFSPLRREIARITIEQLIKDGRIQPSSIEEFASKSTKEVKEQIYKNGQEALIILNISNMSKQLIELIGSLKYRLSFCQNVYDHSIEVASLAGMMAAELGLNQSLAKRAGLLHDIGKAVDHDFDGNHVELGIKIAKEFGECETVINSIASHHGDVEATSEIAVLVQAADALSAGRPGARDKINENFFQRMEQLENICHEFSIVEKAFVLRSGREIRVIVNTQKTTDLDCFELAKKIKEKIEQQVIYPGEIKVVVIREYRVVEKTK